MCFQHLFELLTWLKLRNNESAAGPETSKFESCCSTPGAGKLQPARQLFLQTCHNGPPQEEGPPRPADMTPAPCPTHSSPNAAESDPILC